MKLARTLMVQGTASSVGKSVLTAALCRLLRQDGFCVAPFKSQNMALNAAVTPDGLEIGRAQAVQAEACGIAATVDMNPILLKPEGDAKSQIVVRGRVMASLTASAYHEMRSSLEPVIAESLRRLREAHDVVVIEGAGSPAEVNLKHRDIANMHVARVADAPVLLVGDIDRGGVFASFVGTLELLEPDERARVKAFVVNKFRGDVKLLEPGLAWLERRTGIPVLGVIPYVRDLGVAEEDSVALDDRRGRRRATAQEIEIAVIRTPRISNYDELGPLEREPGVVVRFVERATEIAGADVVILPGSKATVSDLAWLRRSGIAGAILERARAGLPILGICGGFQMLGVEILDPDGIESASARVEGLGLLPIRTVFGSVKTTSQVRARPAMATWLAPDVDGSRAWRPVEGYEIHMGTIAPVSAVSAAFHIVERNGVASDELDGAVSADGTVVGTLVHGLLENAVLRGAFLDGLRSRKGVRAPSSRPADRVSADPFDRLANHVRSAIDERLLYEIAGLSRPTNVAGAAR